jgi:short-subunit dehydrogenase
VQVDLATYEGVDALCAVVAADGRPVEAIALNAAAGLGAEPEDEALDDSLRSLRRDVVSTVYLSRCVLDRMVAEGRGRLLYTAPGPTVPGPRRAVAEASTSFVQSFADGLREELADTGVTVTSLVPGGAPAEAEGAVLGRPGQVADAATVAEQSFEALMAGDEEVVTATLGATSSSGDPWTVPDSLTAAMLRRGSEPGSMN